MSKYVYVWDAQNHWSDKKVVSDDYKLQANETFDVVPDGLNTPITRVTGGWKGATKEEHDAYVKQQQALYPSQQPSNAPTAQDKFNAQLTLDKAKQAKINAQLTLDIAQLKKQLQSNTTQANA